MIARSTLRDIIDTMKRLYSSLVRRLRLAVERYQRSFGIGASSDGVICSNVSLASSERIVCARCARVPKIFDSPTGCTRARRPNSPRAHELDATPVTAAAARRAAAAVAIELARAQ